MPEIFLPTLHPGQVSAWNARTKFYPIRCGRRWGKTQMLETIACDRAAKGRNVGWFTPDYKIQAETFSEIADYLHPIKKQSSRVEGVFRTATGGRIDFWTLENERAGRSRKYHLVIIDEAAFTKPNMLGVWEKAIAPSLWDYQGSAIAASTPNGIDDDNFFYRICNDPELGFVRREDGNIVGDYCAPSWTNPHIPARKPIETDAEWMERARVHWEKVKASSHPLVYQQETEAKFVDWNGVQFFELEKWFIDGKPVPYPERCDVIFATIDTAIKSGQEHDGTAVLYCGLMRVPVGKNIENRLLLLDYDIRHIDGSLLEAWLPNVYRRMDELVGLCGARQGQIGVFVEDTGAGSVLLQASARRGWKASAVDSAFVASGKDERCIGISGLHHQGKIKITQHCYDKLVEFKEQRKNHLMTQVLGFRIGDKDAHRRADDLLDVYTSAVSIGLGNSEGF